MIDHIEKYKKIAEKYGIPLDVAQKICDSQFKFCKTVISSGKDEPVQLQLLGKFEVKPNRRENVKKKREHIKRINDERKKGRQEE